MASPSEFALSDLDPPGAVQWTKGGLFTFASGPRTIYVGVLLGPDAAAATRRRATAVVRSLEVRDEAARC